MLRSSRSLAFVTGEVNGSSPRRCRVKVGSGVVRLLARPRRFITNNYNTDDNFDNTNNRLKNSPTKDDNIELTAAQLELLEGLTDPEWREGLKDAIASDSFRSLADFLHSEWHPVQQDDHAKQQQQQHHVAIYPPHLEIFTALNWCPPSRVRVVIVGQDPYHGPNQGHGLAFSVQRGIRPPPSLMNIFREAGILRRPINNNKSTSGAVQTQQQLLHGNLEYWAQ